MEDAERTEESAEDITAADTEPKPKNAMAGGVKYWSTIGKIIRASSAPRVEFPPLNAVSFQSEK